MFPPNTTTQKHLEYNGQPIPVKVHCERRLNVRFAMGRSHAILRMPNRLPVTEQAKHWTSFVEWTYNLFRGNPKLRQQIFGRQYEHGSTLEIFGRQYNLHIREEARNAHHARIERREIFLTLAEGDHPVNLRKSLRQLISRCVAADCQAEFSRRVHELNHLYFGGLALKKIQFKYNQSNWGSCSADGNLNFSTRLLFAPPDVIDYVIIHELSHLIELNHSDRFWKLVEDAMPDYVQKEKWLKEYGTGCDF